MVVAVDAPVTEPAAYNLSNDQEKYAYLGAKWLFEQLGGKGDVVYMRGIAGHPADTDRDIGFKRALAEYPGIKVVPRDDVSPTGIRPTAPQQINDCHRQRPVRQIDGVWTSGIDNVDRRRLQGRSKPFVPIVGADNSGFVKQLLDTTDYPASSGAAVTNPGSVGGAGVDARRSRSSTARRSTRPSRTRSCSTPDRGRT